MENNQQTDKKYQNVFKAYFSLFNNDKPDHLGTMELSLQDAMSLAEWITSQEGEQNFRGDMVVKIPVKGWNKETKSGKPWISGIMSVDKPLEGEKNDMPF